MGGYPIAPPRSVVRKEKKESKEKKKEERKAEGKEKQRKEGKTKKENEERSKKRIFVKKGEVEKSFFFSGKVKIPF